MVSPKLNTCCPLLGGVLIALAGAAMFADVGKTDNVARSTVPSAVSPSNIVQYVRDRFDLPAAVGVEAQPVRQSPFPHFYQTAVTVNDGKQRRVSDVFITNDALCFVMGNIFALSNAADAEIERCVRAAAKLPATATVSIQPFARSAFPDFLKSTVTVGDGVKVQSGDLYVTRDHRVGILGLVLPYRQDFVERLINTKNQPSVGPANAPVTIVEYADLECPTCAYFQKFLQSEFLPRYGGKVRVIFKEFPLPSHPWSTSAAIANECACQLDPSKFLDYRTLIFGDQELITASKAREELLNLGERAGLDRVRLSTCLDTRASLSRISDCQKEAQILGVSRTPTLFVNGRIVIGALPAQTFYAIVDKALAESANKN